jgi:endonuclease/exonuclease/phosphatase family metal-dependent hydrolase
MLARICAVYALSILVAIGVCSADNARVRVLTLNVFAGKQEMDFARLARQIDAVKDLDPDIIALQELYDERAKAMYREAFPQFHALESGNTPAPPKFSQKLVGLVQGSFELANKAFKVAPWVKGSRALLEGDTHGLMLLTNGKKGAIRAETKLVKRYEIQAAPSPATRLFESVKPKGFILVEYELGGVRILIVNTHLSNGVRNERRIGQLAELAEEIMHRDLNDPRGACPVIFCGDTNADGREPEMQWWHTEAGFYDTYVARNPDLGAAPRRGMTWDNANPLTRGNLTEPDQRVDFISARPNAEHAFEILESKIVLDENPVSDHYGVMTDLRLVPSPGCEGPLRGADVRRRRTGT